MAPQPPVTCMSSAMVDLSVRFSSRSMQCCNCTRLGPPSTPATKPSCSRLPPLVLSPHRPTESATIPSPPPWTHLPTPFPTLRCSTRVNPFQSSAQTTDTLICPTISSLPPPLPKDGRPMTPATGRPLCVIPMKHCTFNTLPSTNSRVLSIQIDVQRGIHERYHRIQLQPAHQTPACRARRNCSFGRRADIVPPGAMLEPWPPSTASSSSPTMLRSSPQTLQRYWTKISWEHLSASVRADHRLLDIFYCTSSCCCCHRCCCSWGSMARSA